MHYLRVNNGSTLQTRKISAGGNVFFFRNEGVGLNAILYCYMANGGARFVINVVESGPAETHVGTSKDQTGTYNNVYIENDYVYIQGSGGSGDCYWAIL